MWAPDAGRNAVSCDDAQLGRVVALTSRGSAHGRILRALFSFGNMSRADLARASSMSRSTVGTALAELHRWGVVDFSAPDEHLRGRPSASVNVIVDRLFGIVLDVSKDHITHAIMRLNGQVQEVERTPLTSTKPARVVAVIKGIVDSRRSNSDGQCVGVGVSIPGIIATSDGVATLVLPLGWEGFPIRDELFQAFGGKLPVRVAQDALIAAKAEFVWGAGASLHRMLYLLARDFGVGGAIVGVDALEGVDHPLQAGHIQVRSNGIPCDCGARGCLEKYSDAEAVRAALGDLGVPGDDLSAAVAAAAGGAERDPFIDRVIDPLRVGLVTLVNALGPDGVVLGGGLGVLATHFLPELQAAVAGTVVARVRDVPLGRGSLESPILMGCGLLAFDALFNDPRDCGIDRTTQMYGGMK